MGRDSDVSTRSNLSENSLSKVEEWETEIKSYYSLSHNFDPDPEDHFELQTQIILLLRAIHKAKYKLFTPDQLRHVNYIHPHTCEKMDKETRRKMFELLIKGRYYDIITHFLPKRKSKQFDEEVLSDLFTCWINEFKGASLMALCDFLVEQERVWSHDKYYAKIIPVIQSSGMGKSRLLSEFGKTILSVYYTTRKPDETGYPPGDTSIRKLLSEQKDDKKSNLLAISFLAATFQQLYAWCSQEDNNNDTEELAKKFHNCMAPIQFPNQDPLYAELPSVSAKISATSSQFRINFCKSVSESASTAYSHTLEKEEPIPEARKGLIESLDKLMDLLKGRKSHRSALFPKVILVFDEASEIPKSLYYAICRGLRDIDKFAVWTFFLSTQSQIEDIAPSKEYYRSERIRTGTLQRFEPFIHLQLDVEVCHRLAHESSRQIELAKSLSSFTTQDHMLMFGRPLWDIYKNVDWLHARGFALYKLLRNDEFDMQSNQHAFAVIASRISLDPCRDTKESTKFVTEAVDSHLRILTGTNIQDGTFVTTTPSEPIVSEAVANLLVRSHNKPTGFENWSSSIGRLANPLIRGGFVNKGLKGELYARLLCVLARDTVLANEKSGEPFPYAQPFSAFAFMQALFGQVWVDSFVAARSLNTRSRGGEQKDKEEKSFQEIFKDGLMNFTHFAYTNESLPLNQANMQELLHYLMYSQTALQLCPNQKDWDLLIPIYFGNRDGPFNRTELSAIAVQVKNTKQKNHMPPGKESTDLFGMKSPPIIHLLLDLGRKENSVTYRVERVSRKPNVHCIHATGANASTFGCLKSGERLEAACAELFQEIIQRSETKLEKAIGGGNFITTRAFGKREELLNACQKKDVEMADVGEFSEIGSAA